jgi:hypothetical protein
VKVLERNHIQRNASEIKLSCWSTLPVHCRFVIG